MSLMQELATQVLIGTDRRPPTLPVAVGEIGDLLGQIAAADGDVETRVLRSAGVLAVCGDAGFMPAAARAPAHAACLPETLRAPDDKHSISLLQQILAEGPDLLRVEALQVLAATDSCLPPRLLPMALEAARAASFLRAVLLPVLGQRGRWLAAQNPDWSFVATGDVSVPEREHWEHGTIEQRQRYLALMRRSDPAHARFQLVAVLPELDARERASLLGQLQVGLGPEDEDLFDGLLQDRSKEVRQLAAAMLSRLPHSRYVERMAARMSACLKTERKLLRRVLNVEPPAQFAADWKQDALEETRAKSETLGDRAWWLYQIARALPLDWWTHHTEMSPLDLLKWASGTDWEKALLRAWREAMAREANAAWAAALLAHKSMDEQDVFELIDSLPLAQREQHWLEILDAKAKNAVLGDVLARIVASIGETRMRGDEWVSVDFARNALRLARRNFDHKGGMYDYTLRKSLVDFVCVIPANALTEATIPWPLDPQSQYFNETAARVLLVVEQRRALNQYFQERKPS